MLAGSRQAAPSGVNDGESLSLGLTGSKATAGLRDGVISLELLSKPKAGLVSGPSVAPFLLSAVLLPLQPMSAQITFGIVNGKSRGEHGWH